MNEELEELKNQVIHLKSELSELREWCQEMFKLNIQNQETTNKRISQMGDRLHHHIMNL